jgi:hypothetical protein
VIDESYTYDELWDAVAVVEAELARWLCRDGCWRCEMYVMPDVSRTRPSQLLYGYWHDVRKAA